MAGKEIRAFLKRNPHLTNSTPKTKAPNGTTPGPWKVEPSDPSIPDGAQDIYSLHHGKYDRLVAEVRPSTLAVGDAGLLAAAPELLESLQLLIARLSPTWAKNFNPSEQKWREYAMRKANEAIKKATK